MQPLVECVPNFSNGRDPEVYNAIADAIRAVPGVQVLDVSADPDHNRTVITFVGGPDDVVEAAFQGIGVARDLIDLDYHRGEHPRIGATDVCPFVPIRDITTEGCVALARRLGKRVGEELGMAVYLYGAAATRPDRESLSDIRKGQYELWKQEVANDARRQPDFGPAEPRPWGATVIGARPFLIAYNLYLNSDDADIAERIAKSVRFSSGGLRYVQARGFLVEGQAQVSMNLTNFERTPIYRVQEMVRREAAQHGLAITRAELVGLIPQKALLDTARWYLQLDPFHDDQVLELRLEKGEAETAQPSAAPFVDVVAAATPTPGGGSVAAQTGALAAALAQMAAGLTVGRKKYADVAEAAGRVLDEADSVRRRLSAAIEEDAAAFQRVMAVTRDKSLDDEAKAVALEAATVTAGEVPLRVMRLSRDAARLAQTIATIGNVNAATDAAVGAIMARAAAEGAGLNVRINSISLKDRALADTWRAEVEALLAEVGAISAAAVATATERGGF